MIPGIRGTLACLILTGGLVSAQERVPLPPPDNGQQGLQTPPRPLTIDNPPPPSGPPQPYNASDAPPSGPPQPYNGGIGQVPPPPPPAPSGPMPPWADPFGPSPYYRHSHAIRWHDPVGDPFLWFNFEGLVWFSKNQPLGVPLVTTGPASQGASAGNLNVPGTYSLDSKLNYGAEGGFRMTVGGWFDGGHSLGLEGGFFVLGQQDANYLVTDRSGTGALVINMPISGSPFNTQVSSPGVSTGSVIVDSTSNLGGFDINLKYNLYRGNGLSLNLLGGYRFVELDESLCITANSNTFTTTTFTDNAGNTLVSAPPGSSIQTFDQFKGNNSFNGGQLGADFQYLWDRWIFGGFFKCAVGDMHEVVTINGYTIVSPLNGNPVTFNGGNYATFQVGRYSTDRFAIIPEGQVSVGYAFTPCVSGHLGYNLLYLSNVVRPGNQIDNTYDGLTHPGVPMASSSYWTQGVTMSVQLKF